MLTKRDAVVAVFTAVVAKMAHADEPDSPPPSPVVSLWQGPTEWWVNLDQMAGLSVRLGGETVRITAAEIFAALKRDA